MQSNLTLDRMAVAAAIEHLLKEQEEGWLEAAQFIVDSVRAVGGGRPELVIPVAHYMLTHLESRRGRVVFFSHIRQSSKSTGALLYDAATLKPHVFARVDIYESESALNNAVSVLANFIMAPLYFLRGYTGTDEVRFVPKPHRVSEWTVIFSTKKDLHHGMTTTKPWRWY